MLDLTNREPWVSNKLIAEPKVIAALLDENGAVNFNKILPLPCRHGTDWEYISCAAEEAAVAIRSAVTSGARGRSIVDLIEAHAKKLGVRCVEQLHSMLRNHEECGYFHDMDFARKVWGTKWNSVNSRASVLEGTACFYTVSNYPDGVLVALSRKFPESEIHLEFEEKDAENSFGKLLLKGGHIADVLNKDAYALAF